MSARPVEGRDMGARILVVDDDKDYLLAVKLMLEAESFNVATAESTGAATKHLKKTRPDLILLDVRMPEKDGFTFCDELAASRNTPVSPSFSSPQWPRTWADDVRLRERPRPQRERSPSEDRRPAGPRRNGEAVPSSEEIAPTRKGAADGRPGEKHTPD